MMTFRLSRELMHLAIDSAAAEAAKRYVEGAFSAQFPGKSIDLGPVRVGFNTIDLDDFNIRINGVDIQWVD